MQESLVSFDGDCAKQQRHPKLIQAGDSLVMAGSLGQSTCLVQAT